MKSSMKSSALNNVSTSQVDSIAWNPHKMVGAPLQTSPFIVRHKKLLHECNSASATYLFQQDKFYDVSFDTGDKSVQCGRKVDAFKLWFMLKVLERKQKQKRKQKIAVLFRRGERTTWKTLWTMLSP